MNSQINWEEEMRQRAAISADAINEGVCNRESLLGDGAIDFPIRCGLDFVAANVDEIKRMLYRLCNYMHSKKHNCNSPNLDSIAVENLVDDVFSECVLEKCEVIYRKYNPAIGTLRGFMFAQLQLYARKWFQSLRARENRLQSIHAEVDNGEETTTHLAEMLQSKDETSARALSALIDSEEVIFLLAQLSEYEARLLRMHAAYGQTFEEIATRLGGGASTHRIAYGIAMQRLIAIALTRE